MLASPSNASLLDSRAVRSLHLAFLPMGDPLGRRIRSLCPDLRRGAGVRDIEVPTAAPPGTRPAGHPRAFGDADRFPKHRRPVQRRRETLPGATLSGLA